VKTEVLALTSLPRAHWQKIWSTNPLERINKEIKRRSRLVGIFPNEAAVIRLVGARAGRHARRMASRRPSLPLRSLYGAALPERETDLSAELKSGDEHRGSTSKPHHSAGRGPIGRGESALQGPLDT